MSSPQKSQTPTLNSLLMKPTGSTTTVQNYGNGGNGAGQEPTPGVYNSMPTTADAYWTQNQRYTNVKGQPPANNFPVIDGDSFKQMPPTGFGPGSYPPPRNLYPAPSSQGNASIYNLQQQPYAPQGNYVGQQSGPSRTSNYGADQESMPNGAPPSLKGNVNSSSDAVVGNQRFQPGPSVNSTAKHPIVATLKQEYPGSSPGSGRSSSPSSNCTGGAPSSPASHMRHSPVSPTPVSVYQSGGGYYPNQSPSMIHPFSNAQPYGGPIFNENSNYPTSAASSNFQPAYSGYPTGVYSNGPNAQSPPSSYGPPTPQMSRFRNPSQGPAGPMGQVVNGPYSGPLNDVYKPPAPQFYNSPGRPPMSVRTTNGPTNFSERLDSPAVADGTDTRDSMHSGNGTPVSDRPRTSTPASGRTKMNGAKESHPSTPAPTSPGGGSSAPDDADSSLSSPSWPRTPMSPAIGRHPSMNSSTMGPPAPVSHPNLNSSTLAGGVPPPSSLPTHKETGLSLVQRLLGDMNQNHYSIQEWEDRRRFYERLVHFCETKGHPLTGQPTVSKQTVDLYRLYMAVKQNGGFEQVTRNKGWKELCQVASLPYTSGASYQLRKHYVRYLLPCECYFDRNGIEPSVLLQSIESKRKSKQSKNVQQQQNFLSQSSSPNSSMGGDIDPDPILTACQGKKKGKGKASAGAAAAASAQQLYPDSLMGPPPVKYGPPMDNHGTPPNPNVPYMPPNANYPGSVNHLVVPGQQQQPNANELVMNPFDDRSPVASQQHHSPHPQSLQYPPPPANQHGAICQQQQQQRPQYGGYPPGKFPNDRNHYDAYSAQQSAGYQNQMGLQQQHGPATNRAVSSNAPSSFPAQNTYPPQQSGFETNSQNNAAVPSNNQYANPPSDGRRTEPQPSPYQVPPSNSAVPAHQAFRTQDPYVSQNNPSTAFYQQPPANHSQSMDGAMQQPVNGPKALETNGPQFYSNAKPPSWIQQSARYGVPLMPNQQLNPPNLPGNIAKDFRLYNPTYSQVYPPHVRTSEFANKSYPSTSVPSTSQRKELSPVSTFPSHTVEATMPFVKRRRKILSRDIGKVDAWRVVMALKSGLAFETTWALNVLNVLLYDDSSVSYFGLSTLPGLLDAVIDLFRRTLAEIFSDLVDFDATDGEVSYETSTTKDDSSIEYAIVSFDSVDDECLTSRRSKFKSFLSSENPNANFTTVTRKGRRVRFVTPKEPLSDETPTIHDIRPLHEYEGEFWQLGGSNSTGHLGSKFDEANDDALKHNFYRRAVGNSSEPPTSIDRRRKRVFDGSFCSCNPSSSCHERKRFKLHLDDADGECPSTATTDDSCHNKKPLFFHSQSRLKNDVDEVFTHNNPPVNVILEFRTVSVNLCVSLSNVLRGLSFITGNDLIMAKHAALLRTLASLLMLGHRHVERRRTPCRPSTVEDIEALKNDTSSMNIDIDDKERPTSTLNDDDHDDFSWMYEQLLTLIDDAFVILCNLSANLDLYNHPENVSRPLIHALLHWAVCRAPVSQDTLLNWTSVAPGRYALEILCKLSVLERNVDLILATPPWDRFETLLEQLVDYLCVIEETVLREFAVVLIHTFCCACPITCVVAALQTSAVQNLISFLEVADAEMHRVVQYHGMQTLRDNPEVIGTSVGMLRRAAGALLAMTKIPACHERFYRHQLRLLNFTMSHLMDSRVGSTIAEALYEIQKDSPKILADSPSNGNEVPPQSATTNPSESLIADDTLSSNVDDDTTSISENIEKPASDNETSNMGDAESTAALSGSEKTNRDSITATNGDSTMANVVDSSPAAAIDASTTVTAFDDSTTVAIGDSTIAPIDV